MSKLDEFHRLPDGTWIMLTEVSLIQPSAEPWPHLIVRVGNTHLSLKFESLDAAQAYGDSLAAAVICARARGQS